MDGETWVEAALDGQSQGEMNESELPLLGEADTDADADAREDGTKG